MDNQDTTRLMFFADVAVTVTPERARKVLAAEIDNTDPSTELHKALKVLEQQLQGTGALGERLDALSGSGNPEDRAAATALSWAASTRGLLPNNVYESVLDKTRSRGG